MEPPAQDPPEPPRRSSYEDYEIPVPAAAPSGRRPAVVSTAALVLLVAGVMNVLYVIALDAGDVAPLYLILGVAQLGAAVLVVMVHPVGRLAALALGAFGILLGLVQATSAPVSGLMSMALNAFVVYAMVAGAPAFRRG